MLTRNAHIIRIHASELIRSYLTFVANGIRCGTSIHVTIVTRFDCGNTSDSGSLHSCQYDGIIDYSFRETTTLGFATILSHLCIPLVLFLRVCQTVANTEASEIDTIAFSIFVALPNSMSDGWHIMSSIAFTDHKERVLREFGKLAVLKECLQELVHVIANLCFVVHSRYQRACRKAGAGRLIHPHDIGLTVPTVLVLSRRSVFVHFAGAILCKQSQLGRAAWTSCEPHHDRIC
mmetsp:Transcript_50370/g.79847  ORF Transcript_50370/g.79847 Transcript_50370/m.79847 type:complete len:234 (+) Transcript_50370:555-1256(+)